MMHPSELKWAYERVQKNRQHVEQAFDELDQKLRHGREAIDRAVEKIQAPLRVARRHPWGSLAFFALLGFLLSIRASRRRRVRQRPPEIRHRPGLFDAREVADEWTRGDSRAARSECL